MALFASSALALPFALEAGYNVETHEIDNDVSSMIHTLRLVLTLIVNTHDLESLKFEACVHLNYLEACEVCLIG